MIIAVFAITVPLHVIGKMPKTGLAALNKV